jgi:hypothetical protein
LAQFLYAVQSRVSKNAGDNQNNKTKRDRDFYAYLHFCPVISNGGVKFSVARQSAARSSKVAY